MKERPIAFSAASVSYESWLESKFPTASFDGIVDVNIPDALYPHQRDLVRWALAKGRAAIFADTGLGKTAMQLEWSRHVAKRGRVLILAPLAVAHQTVEEGKRFGVEVVYVREDVDAPIVITNYEMLNRFDPASFAGVVLDESSILKAFAGATRNAIIEAFANTPYRLACTATPAPNDFTELGNHSEFLGVKSRAEMLAEYFVHDGGSTQDWRLKGHAVKAFWRWVSSWGLVVRKPSDLGHSDAGFDLPVLRMHEHVLPVSHQESWASGSLFAEPAISLSDQRSVRRSTMAQRVATAAELAGGHQPVLIWCELNDEGDALENVIDDAVQVKGSDSPDTKDERLSGFANGRYRVLVTKPSIAGFGLNWQHCATMIFVGASHSYEQTYQAIRRCWRFGQTRPVDVHIIHAETESAVIDNYRRKEIEAGRMAKDMTAHVAEFVRAAGSASMREWNDYIPESGIEVPQWLTRT